ncbi:eukaryotic translation initiation factor 5A-1-like [Watersipora subatra]|uniref:eukaryotic translation initiation factor 5A-1-like n=1 Tax=Watersipora subatra TaxID=2589382 RepID=UPI00355B2C7C
MTSVDSAGTYPVQCSALRKGGYALIKGHPCKVVEMVTCKTGKHGRAKVSLIGIDLFTGKKHQECCPSTHNMDVPVVTHEEFIVVDVGSTFLSLMDDNGRLRSDIRIPEGPIASEMKSKFAEVSDDETLVVSVVKAMGQEKVRAIKLVK